MKRTVIFAITVAMLLMVPMTVYASSPEQLTSISFRNDTAIAEENLSLSGYGDKDSGYATTTIGGRLFASVSGTDHRKLEWSKGEYGDNGMQPVMTGGTKNPWGNGAYIELRTSTKGYENITFSAQLGATNKGPRDYKLQYSVDGVRYYDVVGTFFSVTTNKTMFRAFENTVLPAEAADAELLYVRVSIASNMMVNGTAGLVGTTGGETAINHVVLTGTPLQQTSPTTASVDPAVDPTTTANDMLATTTTTAASDEVVENVYTGENSKVLSALGLLSAAVLVITVGGVFNKVKR